MKTLQFLFRAAELSQSYSLRTVISSAKGKPRGSVVGERSSLPFSGYSASTRKVVILSAARDLALRRRQMLRFAQHDKLSQHSPRLDYTPACCVTWRSR